LASYSQATTLFLDLHQLSPARPDAKLLGAVVERFAALPWENLTKLLAKHGPRPPAALELPDHLRELPGTERLRLSAEVLGDHTRLGSGGTCFSLTNALRRILTDLGFSAGPAMADMRHGANVHCALLVAEGDRIFLLDPGYLVAEPVLLVPGRPVTVHQAGSTLEYRPDGEDLTLHTCNPRGERVMRYRLRPRTVGDEAFTRFWLESFDASGMNGLHLNRVTGEGRLSAHDLNLRIDTGHGKRNLKLRDGYAAGIAERFGVDRDLAERAFRLWERSRCPRP
jgi:arylamine N-acetyltransferase